MKNFEKTSAQTPENAPTNTFWQAISKLPFAKQAMFIASFSALVGCGGDKGDPTPEPYKDTEKPKITATVVVVSDLDGDGVKDDASFNVKATDNKGVKTLDVFVNGNKQNVAENGDVKVLNVPVGTNTRAITVIDTSNNKDELKDTFQVEQNDTTPATFNYTAEAQDLDNTGHANDIVVEVNNATHTSGIKSITVKIDGNIITETNGKHIVKNATVGNHPVEITVINNNDIPKTETKTVEITPPPTPEAVDLPDLTYKKSLDNTTVTEDVSYTSVGNNTGHAIVVKKTINGIATEYILTNVNGDQPEYTQTKASLVNDILAKGLGDALQLNMADTFANGGYGVLGFTVTKITDNNGIDHTTLINQHRETVNYEGYKKAIQYVREDLGIIDEGFSYGPSDAPNTGNDTKLNWQIARAFGVAFSKKMQQTGATDKNTVASWGAEAYNRVKNMTPAQRRNLMLTIATEAGLQSAWD